VRADLLTNFLALESEVIVSALLNRVSVVPARTTALTV